MKAPSLSAAIPLWRPQTRLARVLVVLAVALSLAVVYTIVAPAAHAADSLLSQGQPTTASSLENASFPASNATDGNTGTRWSSAFSDPQWIEVDLGATATIDKVVLMWEAAYATAFQIQTSNDNSTWTSIFSTTTGTGGNQTLTVSGSGRYVRMYGTARATQYGYSLYEFQVFGSLPSTGGCGTANVALGKTTTASSIENAGTPAADATDGNTTTRWSSMFSDPQWLEVDLGSVTSICKVSINWETAYGKSFQIQTSTDNTNWTPIFTTTTGTGGIQTLSVTGSGRYIRMYGTVRGTQYGYSIWEFQVFAGSPGNMISVTNPGNQTGTVGTAASVQISATDSASGQTLTYSASGLPAGLSINSSSGLISGTPTTAATYNPTVTATDTTSASGSTSFTWVINPATGNMITINNPGGQTATVNTPVSLQIVASDSATGQTLTYSASGLPNGLSISSTSGLISGTPSAAGTFSSTVTVKDTTNATNSVTFSWVVNNPAGGCTGQSNTPNFGPNVSIFDPTMATATIQTTLNNIFNTQKVNQFGTQRFAELFKPGTYSGVDANIGYYTSIQGLGQNPDDTHINGDVTVDAFDGTGNATQNFWRSAENLEVTPSAGNTRWAVAQAGPFRRMDIVGGLQLAPASNGFASGGYVADSRVSGQVQSVSQQQWYTQDSNYGSWSGGVWNMVFSGVAGAPAASFPNPPETVLATTPTSRDVPYLYIDSSGNYHVFLPNLRTNSSQASWIGGSTPGTSVPMSNFFVVTPSNTAAQMNTELAAGCSLFFTPGVYNIDQTLQVNNANTVVLGIGMPTLIPIGGIDTIHVADVDGVRLSGLLLDAGTTNSNALLTVGTSGSTTSHLSNPISVQDVFFRIGGDIAGQATDSLVVNANNTLVNDIWAWRADHGNSGTVGWTVNTATTGVIINGNNVLATGMFVEHFQKYDMTWNGQGGEDIFFQNEMPYDPPNQAAWMNGSSNGYAAYEVAPTVTTHQAYGLGSYCFFNVNKAVVADHAFEAPNVSGVQFHDILTVSLGAGVIEHVINSTGAATPSNSTPSDVTTYP
jgi:hypothetical protein